jgi:hypothetical protein
MAESHRPRPIDPPSRYPRRLVHEHKEGGAISDSENADEMKSFLAGGFTVHVANARERAFWITRSDRPNWSEAAWSERTAAWFCFQYAISISLRLTVPLYIRFNREEMSSYTVYAITLAYMLVVMAVLIWPIFKNRTPARLVKTAPVGADMVRAIRIEALRKSWGPTTPFWMLRTWWGRTEVLAAHVLCFVGTYGLFSRDHELYYLPFLGDVGISLFFFIWHRGNVILTVLGCIGARSRACIGNSASALVGE